VGISVRNFLGDEYYIEKKMWFLSSLESLNLPGFVHIIRVGDVIFDMEISDFFYKKRFFFLQKMKKKRVFPHLKPRFF